MIGRDLLARSSFLLALPLVAGVAGCGPAFGAFSGGGGVGSRGGTVTTQFTQEALERPGRSGPCLPNGIDAPLVAFGVYEGARNVGMRVGETDNETTLVSVTGSPIGGDRVLLLMSYEATIWDFTHAPTGRIKGVIVSGYYDQAVSNLPAEIPVAFAARSNTNRQRVCANLGYAYEGGPELDRVAEAVRRATGVEIAAFGGAYSAGSVSLGSDLQPSRQTPSVRPGLIRAAVRVRPEDVLPREAGLQQLLESGVIRPATAADVAAWNQAATRRLRTRNLAPYESDYLHPMRSFVVLGAMTTPPGMYGAYRRDFIIARGVPMPVDRGSHNGYYRLSDGTCSGAGPDCHGLAFDGED